MAPDDVTSPVTVNVPPILVSPVVSATVNLLLSIVNPPLRTVAPVTVNESSVPVEVILG